MKASTLSRAAGTTTNPVDIPVDRPCLVHAGNMFVIVCHFDAREIFSKPKGQGGRLLGVGLLLLFNPL